jgi:hypothetical protein
VTVRDAWVTREARVLADSVRRALDEADAARLSPTIERKVIAGISDALTTAGHTITPTQEAENMTEIVTIAPALAPDLAAALVAALGELADVGRTKTADAGQYRYRYADLAAVLEQVRPVLARHGLAVMQAVDTEPAGQAAAVSVSTLVVHVSGAVHQSPPLRLTAPNDPQKVGSAVTYARRYSLMATLGIAAADEDDDGAAARPAPPAARRAEPSTRSDAERAIRAMIADVDPDIRQRVQTAFRDHYCVGLSDLPVDRHDEALAFVTGELEDALHDADDRAAADGAHAQAEVGGAQP